jgi:hypothetical protein
VADPRRDASNRYRHGVAPEDRVRVPYYGALLDALSTSDVAIDLLLALPDEQRLPILILAILHFHALGGHGQLAPLYEPLPRGGDRPPDEFAANVRAILEGEPDLVLSQLHRRTQTNEIGRSATLRAVLSELHGRGLDEVNLVDIGCSAGLNLYLDKFSVGSEPSELVLACETLTPATFTPIPTIEARVGIDINPLDLRDPDDARWLRACLWPEEPLRLRRLETVESLLPTWPPLTLLRGSVMERLDDAVSACGTDHATLFMHTWAAAYFPETEQRALGRRLRELCEGGNYYWVSCEWGPSVGGLELPPPRTELPRPGACQIAVTEPGQPTRDWGWSHAHGRWIALSPPER